MINKEKIIREAVRRTYETFWRNAEANGMDKRYMQSLRITENQSGFDVELDYRGRDNDEPLGYWFEFGTRSHFIAPVEKKALSWIGGGIRFFSKGHWVSGIQSRSIMRNVHRDIKLFMPEIVKQNLKRE